jgi:predicted MFS family arabinose efflux permease
MGSSFILLSFATNLLLIGLAVCLWGAAASIYHPAGLSLISTGVKDSGTGFAYHGMAGNAGIALGPLIAVLLLWVTKWRIVAFVLTIPAFVAVGYILQTEIDELAATRLASDGSGKSRQRNTSLSELTDASRSLFLGGFLFVFLIIVFNGLYYRGILTFLPELLAGFVDLGAVEHSDESVPSEGIDGSDLIYVGLLMVGIFGQYVGGKATDKIQVERGLLIGYTLLIGIALLYVPAAQFGLVFLIVISALLGFVLFALQPMYQVAVAEYSPADVRGLSYGYTYLAQFGVGALGAAIVGILLTHFEIAAVFLVLATCAFVAMAFSLFLYSRTQVHRNTW